MSFVYKLIPSAQLLIVCVTRMELDMDNLAMQLFLIQKNIHQASVCEENGIARLHYNSVLKLLQEITIQVEHRKLSLESAGEQPKEVFCT
ncbi:hypothetical protein I4U23_023494 [Adineta vaga]|nr:hypothetical protein I4U23_023494 [Adineta vaga]